MLKATVMAGSMCLAMSASAHAKCGTNQLNGNWFMHTNAESVKAATILNGAITVTGGGNIFISQTADCKVTISTGGLIYKGSSESIAKTSSLKPRQIDVAEPVSDISIALVRR
jgi:hypothetical protein